MMRIYLFIINIFLFVGCNNEFQNEISSIELIRIGPAEKVNSNKDLFNNAGATWYYKIDLEQKNIIFKNIDHLNDDYDHIIQANYYKFLLSDSLQYLSNKMLGYIKGLKSGPIKNSYFEKDEYPYYSGGEYIVSYKDEKGNQKFHCYLNHNLPNEIENWHRELKDSPKKDIQLINIYINTDSIAQFLIDKLKIGERVLLPMPKDTVIFVSPNLH